MCVRARVLVREIQLRYAVDVYFAWNKHTIITIAIIVIVNSLLVR